ncbi:NAD-dependent epimerase/dehydratase family protein [Nocardia cyriacigeorgica]|uniref:NAD-dependent epimerase/dehydratase family protein n=1 Tax=Nocardia cyriacigeorgica TaxID=135487 RepID=UPI00245480C6|nr:NAD-dependent epimerase/dehydratase family protein [Nocardia cyriacigeorgica]
MNHVVVTGGAGFLGSHLCRALLACGDRVTAIDDLSTGRASTIAHLHAHPWFALRKADVTAVGAFADLDSVTHMVHLAGAGGSDIRRRPVETIRAASTGTLAALDLASARSARIVVSGAHATPSGGRARIATGGSELDRLRAAAELIAESSARHYPDANVGIVRPFEVYGPHQRPGSGIGATICAAALRDQTVYLTDDEARSFIYVADVADAVIAMLDSDIPGPVDIGGPMIALSEFTRLTIDLAGRGWLETPPSPESGAGPDIPPGVAATVRSGTRPPNLIHTHAVLGWKPTTSLPTGLCCTLDSIQAVLSASRTGEGRGRGTREQSVGGLRR